jgi:hypothetical protein
MRRHSPIRRHLEREFKQALVFVLVIVLVLGLAAGGGVLWLF